MAGPTKPTSKTYVSLSPPKVSGQQEPRESPPSDTNASAGSAHSRPAPTPNFSFDRDTTPSTDSLELDTLLLPQEQFDSNLAQETQTFGNYEEQNTPPVPDRSPERPFPYHRTVSPVSSNSGTYPPAVVEPDSDSSPDLNKPPSPPRWLYHDTQNPATIAITTQQSELPESTYQATELQILKPVVRGSHLSTIVPPPLFSVKTALSPIQEHGTQETTITSTQSSSPVLTDPVEASAPAPRLAVPSQNTTPSAGTPSGDVYFSPSDIGYASSESLSSSRGGGFRAPDSSGKQRIQEILQLNPEQERSRRILDGLSVSNASTSSFDPMTVYQQIVRAAHQQPGHEDYHLRTPSEEALHTLKKKEAAERAWRFEHARIEGQKEEARKYQEELAGAAATDELLWRSYVPTTAANSTWNLAEEGVTKTPERPRFLASAPDLHNEPRPSFEPSTPVLETLSMDETWGAAAAEERRRIEEMQSPGQARRRRWHIRSGYHTSLHRWRLKERVESAVSLVRNRVESAARRVRIGVRFAVKRHFMRSH
ncbi:hypothetical protein EJ05DRAFT_498925 [Pseudovirgaria hyperparasitica]|uniref:Uncharacterized protein n=1 Tax=Pseudovirgaria hyperparasitica TaxID=470096 RepID=A0A6A6WAM4_9PEZI|nr:uncharacterized protein EJ05DRAFT_498925 [Pseudovirgaria hyperparasitica]KAF2759723.1 hypothetical protein EJ05DRAFT_498925 [Pseudovirgaria hyperparasitica]